MTRGLAGMVLALAVAAVIALPTRACTIFVLVDRDRALFFNNEDYSNPRTRIWFVPAGKDYFGSAYIGFDDGCPQGGLNSEGLAYDWVAGFDDKYEPSPKLKVARGFSSMRMLETCRTLDEAINFYKTHREVEFRRSRILIADKTGASAIIGARDGKLLVQRERQCRGFGYGDDVLRKMLKPNSPATVENGVSILRAAMQKGEFATKYSNIYDLKSGDIFLFQLAAKERPVKLSLAAELAKGGHYYDLPELQTQTAGSAKPLLNNMKRFYIDEFKPIADVDPALHSRLASILRAAGEGVLTESDYSAKLWTELSGQQEKVKADLARLGTLKSLTLVARDPESSPATRHYRVEYSKAIVLQSFQVDAEGRICASESEGVEFLPGN